MTTNTTNDDDDDDDDGSHLCPSGMRQPVVISRNHTARGRAPLAVYLDLAVAQARTSQGRRT